MDIPIGVDVFCGTEPCGRSTYLVINPVNDQITHLVIAENAFPHLDHLVPVDKILETSPTSIRLRCSPEDLARMEPFKETHFINAEEGDRTLPFDEPYLMWPYSLYTGPRPIPVEYEHIPAGEVLIRPGSQVKATDGFVGRVDEFLANPANEQISHLIMREGHLWGRKDVTIPVSEIERIEDDVVYLKLDKEAIAMLPVVPMHRKWV